ncbi:hypothetical protein R5H30_02510 [Sulfitobacter sp. D35]|uniref:hypothetical protein n=1 Tax=Sulfitobacter sp. D35 TaxID=3083252 RepID=UPI00296FF6FD|nr:hypothetical protein [Sulfitobacter sp. D35]MDW4496839.1 hypothetical protein [Sulfitobacter sp. D35]
MKLILHAGAHFTEEDRLMKCLLRNKEDFARRGTAVPGPGRYRQLLRDAMFALRDAPAATEAHDILLDAILDDESAERLILSHPHLFGAPRAALRNGLLYVTAPERLVHVSDLFRGEEVHLYMALRNPASFLPACFGQSPREELADFMDGVDPRKVRWSDMLNRVREALPELPMTVWCNEDAPLLWAEIIRDMAGLEPGEKIVGAFDLLSSIMSPEGMARFRAYLKTHDALSDGRKRRVMRAFLDRFAIAETLEEEVDMPGWSQDLVSEMSDLYDADMERVEEIPGLRLLLP